MTNTPLVSIIIPTYNRAHLIGETLDSVLAQTYTHWECIVVDDGSTDTTEAILQVYCGKDIRFQYYKRPNNTIKGASSCRNYGLDKATGLYVIFLDSDDVLLPNCVLYRIQKTQEVPDNYFWVFPMMVQNNGKTNMVAIPQCDDYLLEFLSCNIHWGIMCTLWDINFLKTIHGFNTLYPRLNDPEIHIRAMLEAHSSYVVFYDAPPDCIYREAPIADKNAYALNYFKALQIFIPDISKKLIAHQKRAHIVLLKHYLDHYIKDFEKHTVWKHMMVLFGVFYKNKVISISDYYSSSGKYLLLKLFNVIFKKIKN